MIGNRSGTRIGKYEIVAPLGAGSMGSVYLAYDPDLEREVVTPVEPPEPAPAATASAADASPGDAPASPDPAPPARAEEASTTPAAVSPDRS